MVSNFTFAVEADAWVKQGSPTSNYGALSYVSVDGAPDPMEESYLRFTVGGLSGPIQNAKLRVFVSTDGTNNGPASLPGKQLVDRISDHMEYQACTTKWAVR